MWCDNGVNGSSFQGESRGELTGAVERPPLSRLLDCRQGCRTVRHLLCMDRHGIDFHARSSDYFRHVKGPRRKKLDQFIGDSLQASSQGLGKGISHGL